MSIKNKTRHGVLRGPRYVLTPESHLFPDQLKSIPSAPSKLYVVGNPKAITEGIAIIGARKATPYGISCAANFARMAALKGVCVISGGAYGCDSAAHRAALEVKGETVVFLGGGCDCIYPQRHFPLFQNVVNQGGAIVSEYAWDEQPRRPYFLARNRLIAGAAKAVLIVEAGLPSGTFSTAEEALKANKDVLVVPGAITSPSSHGANTLLFQGAIPVIDNETFEEVLFWLFGVLRHKQEGKGRKGDEDPSSLVYDALRAQPMRLEDLLTLEMYPLESFETKRQRIQSELLELETTGKVVRYTNGRYGPVVGS